MDDSSETVSLVEGKSRLRAEMWKKYNFTPIKRNNIRHSKCGVCGLVMRNTSEARFKMHRRKCIFRNGDGDEDYSDESTKRARNQEFEVKELRKQYKVILNEKGLRIGSKCLKCGKILKNSAIMKLKQHQCNRYLKNVKTEEAVDLLDFDIIPESDEPLRIIKVETLPEFVQCDDEQQMDVSMEDEEIQQPTTKPLYVSNKSTIQLVAQNSEQHQVNVEAVIADLFYSTSLPFSLVENDFFKKFVGYLNAKIKLPHTKQLATTLLEKSFNRCSSKVKRSKEHSILLLENFTTETTGLKLVGFLNNHEKQRIFLKYFDYDNCLEVSDNISQLNDFYLKCLNELYGLIEEKYKTKIYAVLWNNMDSINASRNVAVWHFTSSFHLANRLANNFVDDNLRHTVIRIFEEFQQPQLVESGGNKIQTESASLNCLVYLNLCKTLLHNLDRMKLIATNESIQICPIVSKKIFDEIFVDDLKNMLSNMSSFHTLLEVSMDVTTTLGDIAEQWLTLVPPHNRVDWHQYQVIALNKYVIVANYLHPKYLGTNLMSHHLEIIDDFLVGQLTVEGLDSWEHLRNKRGIFDILLQKKVYSPITFWNIAERKHKELSALALKLHHIPITAGKVLTKLRLPLNTEHLSEESFEKLVFLYFHLAFKNAKAQDW